MKGRMMRQEVKGCLLEACLQQQLRQLLPGNVYQRKDGLPSESSVRQCWSLLLLLDVDVSGDVLVPDDVVTGTSCPGDLILSFSSFDSFLIQLL